MVAPGSSTRTARSLLNSSCRRSRASLEPSSRICLTGDNLSYQITSIWYYLILHITKLSRSLTHDQSQCPLIWTFPNSAPFRTWNQDTWSTRRGDLWLNWNSYLTKMHHHDQPIVMPVHRNRSWRSWKVVFICFIFYILSSNKMVICET